MNILLVSPFYAPQVGGVATYVEDLRRSLANRGHVAVVLLPGDSHSISPRGCGSSAIPGVFEFFMREFWYPQSRVKGLVASGVYFFPTLIKLFLFLRRHHISLVLLEYPVPYMFYFYILRMMVPFKLSLIHI